VNHPNSLLHALLAGRHAQPHARRGAAVGLVGGERRWALGGKGGQGDIMVVAARACANAVAMRHHVLRTDGPLAVGASQEKGTTDDGQGEALTSASPESACATENAASQDLVRTEPMCTQQSQPIEGIVRRGGKMVET
jgi:hypothetical protein